MKKTYIDELLGRYVSDYQKFHTKTKITKLSKLGNSRFWPKEWKEFYYKGYARFKEFNLLKPSQSKLLFTEVLEARHSTRNFSSKPLSLQKISDFLYWGAGVSRNKSGFSERRMYPSGGARFPLEVYVISQNTDLPKGVYHYYVKNNSLEKISNFKQKDIKNVFNQSWVKKAGCLVVITAVFNRNTIKYGDRGYRHVLVEAGHLAQNFYLLAAALSIGCCGVGAYVDDAINKILDADSGEESVVYILGIGEKPTK